MEAILNDTIHGSSYIAKMVLEYVISNCEELDFQQDLEKIQLKFPDMTIIQKICTNLLQSNSVISDAKILLSSILNTQGLVNNFKSLPTYDNTNTILTFSHSHTVSSVLSAIEHKNIYCMKSEPGGEGEVLAKDLNATIIEDNDGYQLIRNGKIDLVVCGCDSYSDNYVVNKIGTADLFKIAQEYKIPVIILTSSLKYTSNVSLPENELFEKITRSLNYQIITEEKLE